MKHVKVEIKNQVHAITLNRPEKRNAFHPEMIAELTTAFKAAASARAVVLSGAGESFCSGGDLDWMKSMAKYTFDENVADSQNLFDMFEAARNCPAPILGRIHGHAFGGALGLVAICDIAAAVTDTQFCFSEAKWGLVPAIISSFVLEKMSHHRAREWMLTAKIFSAAEAESAGLVHFQGAAADVDKYLDFTLKLIAKAGPESIRETKKLLRFLSENPRSAYRKECSKVIAERRSSSEGQAGLKAFLEKGKTPWS